MKRLRSYSFQDMRAQADQWHEQIWRKYLKFQFFIEDFKFFMEEIMEKTHWKKVKGTDYLGEWSIQDEDLILTIKEIKTEMVPNSRGEKDEKYVIHFDECKEGLVVSAKVVLEAIAEACGSPYIEDWIGHKIALYKEQGRWFGKVQYAVRVRGTAPAVIECEACGKVIKSAWGLSANDVAANSQKKFGKKLCAECSAKAKKEDMCRMMREEQ